MKKIIYYVILVLSVLHGLGAIVLFWLGAFEDKICSYNNSPCIADWTSRGLFLILLTIVFSMFTVLLNENRWDK